MYIYDKAHEMAKLIRESPEYAEYKAGKDKVYADERAASLVEEYRKMQFEAQAAFLSGSQPEADLMDRIQKLGAILQFNPEITAFLIAERRFHQILSDIYAIIGEAAEVDLSFLKG